MKCEIKVKPTIADDSVMATVLFLAWVTKPKMKPCFLRDFRYFGSLMNSEILEVFSLVYPRPFGLTLFQEGENIFSGGKQPYPGSNPGEKLSLESK